MASSPAIHVSLEEYLNTEYEPDCDYVDGVLEERNVGKRKHSVTQSRLAFWLQGKLNDLGLEARVEQRVQVSSTRVRVPDICVLPIDDRDEITHKQPALWIEILSPDDRFSRIQRKSTEILTFGVPTLWIIDPYDLQAWIGRPKTGIILAEDAVLRCDNLNLQIALEDFVPSE